MFKIVDISHSLSLFLNYTSRWFLVIKTKSFLQKKKEIKNYRIEGEHVVSSNENGMERSGDLCRCESSVLFRDELETPNHSRSYSYCTRWYTFNWGLVFKSLFI